VVSVWKGKAWRPSLRTTAPATRRLGLVCSRQLPWGQVILRSLQSYSKVSSNLSRPQPAGFPAVVSIAGRLLLGSGLIPCFAGRLC
jgi:hypothetical protein